MSIFADSAGLFQIITALVLLVGLFGWSHNALRTQTDKLQQELDTKFNETQLRLFLQDKLEPFRVELNSIDKQLNAMDQQYNLINAKLDQLYLLICKHEKS